jgi:WS/DGAT/MGAT family acyltransferase
MPQTLSSVDTAWYRLDSPTDPADIIGVLIFDGQVDFERLRAAIETRFLRFERFRQRIDDSGMGRPQWRDVPSFRLDDHLHRTELGEPADREALEAKIAEVMNEPLDKSRPLWRIVLVEDYDEGSALIAHIHHCLGDGFALANVLLNLADHDPKAPWPSSADLDEVDAEDDAAEHHWFRDVVLEKAEDLIEHPSMASKVAKKATKSASTLARLAAMPFDPPTLLKREPTGTRCVSWSDGIALEYIKELARSLGGTVNDVLMAALAGAYRRYLIGQGERVDGEDIRALVPVNLRPQRRIEDMPDKLGNHFGLVFLTLPVSEATPKDRFARTKQCMDELKKSPEAFILFQVFNAAGYVPAWLEHAVANLLGKKASTVATNVPGPREPLYLGGRPIKDIMFWAPHPARLGSNTSIISYNGVVRVGVRGDENVMPDPEVLVGYFDEEIEVLSEASL